MIFIAKAILFYVTLALSIIYIMGVDSIVEKGFIIPTTLLLVFMIYLNFRFISSEDFDKLTFSKYL